MLMSWVCQCVNVTDRHLNERGRGVTFGYIMHQWVELVETAIKKKNAHARSKVEQAVTGAGPHGALSTTRLSWGQWRRGSGAVWGNVGDAGHSPC